MSLTRSKLVADIETMLKAKYPDHNVTAGDRGVTIAKDDTSWTIGVASSKAIIRATTPRKSK